MKTHIWISVSRSSPLPLPPAVWAVLTPTSREDHASPHCTAMECMARGLISERPGFIIIYSLRAGNSVPINTEPPHLSKETPVDSLLTGNNICSRDETSAQEAEDHVCYSILTNVGLDKEAELAFLCIFKSSKLLRELRNKYKRIGSWVLIHRNLEWHKEGLVFREKSWCSRNRSKTVKLTLLCRCLDLFVF